MDGWEVRQYRARVIRFDDRTWRVTGKTTGTDGAIHYELRPWIPGEQDITGHEIEYSAAYVAKRDEARVAGRKRGRTTGWLRYASPIIGFLPAHTKGRLEATYGVDPVSTTFQSVFCEFLISVCAFALAAIPAIGLPIYLFIAVAVVAGVDGSYRYSRILAEERPPPGFYEWAFKKRRGVN